MNNKIRELINLKYQTFYPEEDTTIAVIPKLSGTMSYLIYSRTDDFEVINSTVLASGEHIFTAFVGDHHGATPYKEPSIKKLIDLSEVENFLDAGSYLIFSSSQFKDLIGTLGIDLIKKFFDQFLMAKIVPQSDRPGSLQNQKGLKCIYQNDVIEWLYEIMLEGNVKFSAEVLDVYLELYGPRELRYIDNIQFIKKQIDTGLPNGMLASIFNAGGNPEAGWLLYRDAVKTIVLNRCIKLPHPFWDGEDFSDKKILFRREPGPSDEILYSNIFNELICLGCDVIIEVDERLVNIFKRSFPRAEVFPRSDPPNKRLLSKDIHFQANYSDPFELLRNDLNKYPKHEKYLFPDKQLSIHWKNYLNNITKKPRIGISWSTGATSKVSSKYSTYLEDWLPILNEKRAEFFSLQYVNSENEIEKLYREFGVKINLIEEIDMFNDLENLAALISQLDLVISINNINSQLGSALGVETWQLVPNFWYFLHNTKIDHFNKKAKNFIWNGLSEPSKVIPEVCNQLKIKLDKKLL